MREKCANSQLWEKPQFVRLFLCAPRQLKELGKNTPHRMQAKTLAAEITSALLYQLSYTGPATRPPAPPCLHGKTGYAWTGKAGLLYP